MYAHTHTHKHSVPAITIPSTSYMLPLLQDAFVIAIVTFSVSVSVAQVFARQFSYSIDSSQVGWTVLLALDACM